MGGLGYRHFGRLQRRVQIFSGSEKCFFDIFSRCTFVCVFVICLSLVLGGCRCPGHKTAVCFSLCYADVCLIMVFNHCTLHTYTPDNCQPTPDPPATVPVPSQVTSHSATSHQTPATSHKRQCQVALCQKKMLRWTLSFPFLPLPLHCIYSALCSVLVLGGL